jgi:phosphatidylserine synthase
MSEAARPSGSCLARLIWFGIGPAIMLILAMVNMERGGGWLTTIDVAYFVVLGITILARVIDFKTGNPQTATGMPATSVHLRRYVPGILLVATAVWGVTNFIGNR